MLKENKIINVYRAALLVLMVLLFEEIAKVLIGLFPLIDMSLKINIMNSAALIYLNVLRIFEVGIVYFITSLGWKGTWRDLGFVTDDYKEDIKWAGYFIIGLGFAVVITEVISLYVFKTDLFIYLVDNSLAINDFSFIALYFFTACVSAVIAEELIFRQIIFGTLRSRFNVVNSILITSAVFAVLHLAKGFYLIIPFMGGILFAVLYEIRGNLIAPIILHSAGNLVLTLVTIIYRTK